MSKVVPVPGPKFFFDRDRVQNFFWLGPASKFFLNRTGTKMFFLGRDRDQNIFDWDRHQNLFLKGPGPRPKTSFRRDWDQNFFLPGPGPKFFFHRDRDQKWLVPLISNEATVTSVLQAFTNRKTTCINNLVFQWSE
jgi:hypothetical protein